VGGEPNDETNSHFSQFCVGRRVGVGATALACACARVALLIQHATRRHIAI
jgi:hypothetical protein